MKTTKRNEIKKLETRIARAAKCPPHYMAEFKAWFRTTGWYRWEMAKLEVRFFFLELKMAMRWPWGKR